MGESGGHSAGDGGENQSTEMCCYCPVGRAADIAEPGHPDSDGESAGIAKEELQRCAMESQIMRCGGLCWHHRRREDKISKQKTCLIRTKRKIKQLTKVIAQLFSHPLFDLLDGDPIVTLVAGDDESCYDFPLFLVRNAHH